MTAPTIRLLFDADILIKLSVLDCFKDAIEALGFKQAECATMRSMTRSAGVDNQVVREERAGVGKPARRLFTTLRAIPTIDSMSETERQLAVRIIAAAQSSQLYVDGGEALLFSVSISRGLPYVTTGDKKAIMSLPQLSEAVAEIAQLKGLLMPLEFLLMKLLEKHGFSRLEPRLTTGRACDVGVSKMLEEAAGDGAAFEALVRTKLAMTSRRAPGYLCP